MPTFLNSSTAEDFLANEIVAQAQREGVDLSEVERKMLHYSEANQSSQQILELNLAFELETSESEYEDKIGKLVSHILSGKHLDGYLKNGMSSRHHR